MSRHKQSKSGTKKRQKKGRSPRQNELGSESYSHGLMGSMVGGFRRAVGVEEKSNPRFESKALRYIGWAIIAIVVLAVAF
ncbi:MAG: hypothetical protein R3A47_03100 [Polyangiales bacterium]